MNWALDLKKPIFLFIEDHPGTGVLALQEKFGGTIPQICEYLEVLLYENRIYCMEMSGILPQHFHYYAYPRPSAWEHLLRDDFMV